MIISLIIKFIVIVIAIGILGLIPLFFVNRRSAKIDSSMQKKTFHASENLKNFKTNEIDDEDDPEKKLKPYKFKD